MKKILAALLILVLLFVDFLEFNDLFERKTLPELLTGLVSIPIVIIFLQMLLEKPKNS